MINFDKIKGAIFDLDGTLIDSMQMWTYVEAEYLVRLGITPSAELSKEVHKMGQLEIGEYFRTHYGVKKTAQEITDEKNAMMEVCYYEKAEIKPGVIPVLEALRLRGVKMCIATQTDRYLAEAGLKRLALSGYFERIFTGGEENTSKNRPDIFITAAKFLGTKVEETVVFEDALHAVTSAKGAGFPVVAVFDQAAAARQEEIKKLADKYYYSFEELEIK